MKKRILLLIIMVSLLFVVSGCNKSTTTKKNDDLKTIELNDKNHGFNTTFYYSKNEKYEVKEQTGGKYKEIVIKNEKNNIEFDIYYFEILDNNYESSKSTRKDSEGFKEYKWGDYKGYIYNANKYSLNFNILLRKQAGDKSAVGIFGEVSALNYSKADVVTDFNKKEIQDLLSSIIFNEK